MSCYIRVYMDQLEKLVELADRPLFAPARARLALQSGTEIHVARYDRFNELVCQFGVVVRQLPFDELRIRHDVSRRLQFAPL